MNIQETKYELLKENTARNQRSIYLQVSVLIILCVTSSVAVYSTWTAIYQIDLNIPPKLFDVPRAWIDRANIYANQISAYAEQQDVLKSNAQSIPMSEDNAGVIKLGNETIYPSKLGNFIYSLETSETSPSSSNATSAQSTNVYVPSNQKLVCYYAMPNHLNHPNELYPDRIDSQLCTHINVGIVYIMDNQMVIDDTVKELFRQTSQLKHSNPNLKVLVWVGGANSVGFSEMVQNHANRKQFIRSLKSVLETYRLDGVDIDWEFPSAHNRERQHFSQLLHEIRREYEREHRTYLLSVAVAAPEGIVFYAYDIGEINKYADYVNVMTYDYHFYSTSSPFTGLNAPLYQRHDEHSIFGTLNINSTVSYWHQHGLDKNKIIIGLPTYGHSFSLVNPFNAKLGAPASGYGKVGSDGFTTYSDICWFKRNNFFITDIYDEETCSPYLYAGSEWISYENEESITCKTNYVKANGYGGVMIFSLNTDDYSSYCYYGDDGSDDRFPLVRKINSILFDNNL